jgi:hypothetical protein
MLDVEAQPAIPSPSARQDPAIEAERSEEVARLMADVQTLPVAQRSALLMREVQGLSYQELADSLDVSVPAVKSLLLRARTGLLDLKVARELPCAEIQLDLAGASDRGVRMNARCRRHVRECAACRAYHRGLRVLDKRLGALAPVGALAKLAGIFSFGGGGSSAAGGGAAGAGASATGGGAGIVGGVTAAGAAKVAAVVATVAVIGTAAPVAIHAVTSPPPPRVSLPADAHTLTQTTGASVGPSSSGAASATPAGPLPSEEQTASVPLLGTGDSGTTGASGASGATGTTGVTGTSGATGATDASGAPGETMTATAPPPAAGSTGPTASAASASGSPDGGGATTPTGDTSGGATAPTGGTSAP